MDDHGFMAVALRYPNKAMIDWKYRRVLMHRLIVSKDPVLTDPSMTT